jgi:hypothetical protein
MKTTALIIASFLILSCTSIRNTKTYSHSSAKKYNQPVFYQYICNNSESTIYFIFVGSLPKNKRNDFVTANGNRVLWFLSDNLVYGGFKAVLFVMQNKDSTEGVYTTLSFQDALYEVGLRNRPSKAKYTWLSSLKPEWEGLAEYKRDKGTSGESDKSEEDMSQHSVPMESPWGGVGVAH